MQQVTIYALICPLCNQCRWVGKTTETRLERRLSKHLWHSTGHYNPPKRQWLNHLGALGVKPTIVPLEVVPQGEWIAAETWWMSYFRALGASLYNRRQPC